MATLQRLFVFLVLFAITLLLGFFLTGQFFPDARVGNIWFYSGIVMVLISQFFIEPYYSAPSNVTINSLSVMLVMVSIKGELKPSILATSVATSILLYCTTLFLLSMISVALASPDHSSQSIRIKVSTLSKEIAVSLGKGKVIYSVVFFGFLLLNYSVAEFNVIFLLLFWAFIILFEPQKWTPKIIRVLKKGPDEIGEVFGVQSKKMFLARLFNDRSRSEAISKFDPVAFKYSMRDQETIYEGIVFDKYLLNRQKWIKILLVNQNTEAEGIKRENVIYKISKRASPQIEEFLKRFVGIIAEDSAIETILFEYSSIKVNIQEGDLLEVKVGSQPVYYQVSNGVTRVEILEQKNETGYIKGNAIQLGTWNHEDRCFEKFGWVPEVNTPVFLARTDEPPPELKLPEYQLGHIPSTSFPVIVDLETAVSHHIGILGVTGSGKSFIARELIRQIMEGNKVIVVDFTGEWMEELKGLSPVEIIHNKDGLEEVEQKIALLQDEKRSRQGQATKILEYKKDIEEKLLEYVSDFLEGQDQLAIFELPDLSNTSFILEFTQLFLDCVFQYAKTHTSTKICIVVEEAHTVVPETNSLGDLGDYGSNKALVNKIGQIALQGRKYGVGFMVIAQRTANVSKTVLTQCNTLICFKAFDKTSYDFLSNYFGDSYAKLLPHLRQYHAIVAGKAFKSALPMIVDLTRDSEPSEEVKES